MNHCDFNVMKTSNLELHTLHYQLQNKSIRIK